MSELIDKRTQGLFTVAEAAAYLRLGRTKTYDEISAGRLRAVRIGKRRLVAAQDLEAYVEGLRSAAND